MKEKLYTIPINDAVSADDECPICNARRSLENDAIDYAIGPGASYMESDIREMTDSKGFCERHYKKMYEYGNSLGNALILSTHIRKAAADLKKEMASYKAVKSGLFTKGGMSNVERYIDELTGKCFVCDYYRETYKRYIATFFYLYENDGDFRKKIKDGKGFCLPHMKELLSEAPSALSAAMLDDFAKTLFEVQSRNLDRIEEDISWFVEKFKYENKDKDWKQSKDAIPRTIQKLAGGYPADGPYTGE
ncbi:MAG: DUF6062 family protein [Lachnospiraceae bacterium]|nr:DUF6062 family protein [Lachnospiraceae bacterium]